LCIQFLYYSITYGDYLDRQCIQARLLHVVADDSIAAN